MDEVDRELATLSTVNQAPLDMTLDEVTTYLNKEWNNDTELSTLTLREVLTLLDISIKE